MQRPYHHAAPARQPVSILIRPEGRMQRPEWPCPCMSCPGFNPHPARRPDATPARCSTMAWMPFQSSSGQKAGCNDLITTPRPPANLFQSSSGQKAGCNRTLVIDIRDDLSFQSSSGQKAGCNGLYTFLFGALDGFQSSSGQKAGCNVVVSIRAALIALVSILIRPEGRMQRAQFILYVVDNLFQSSSGQKAGCNLVFFDQVGDPG